MSGSNPLVRSPQGNKMIDHLPQANSFSCKKEARCSIDLFGFC